MKALLLAGGVALLVAMLGTPLLIGDLRARGIGQQIREDGPAGHFSKAGTPTMGGLAIMAAAVVGWIVAHVFATFTTRGLAGMLTICAAALVGFHRRLVEGHPPAQPGPQQTGQDHRPAGGGPGLRPGGSHLVEGRHPSFLYPFNSLGLQLGKVGWVLMAVLIFVGFTNAVNLTDGLDGLAAGSSAFTFVAFTVIGFYQLKHEVMYRNPAVPGRGRHGRGADRRLHGLFVVERGAGPDIHGRYRFARHRRRRGRPGAARECRPPPAHHRRSLRPGDAVGDSPGGQLPDCSGAVFSAWPLSTTTSSYWDGPRPQ